MNRLTGSILLFVLSTVVIVNGFITVCQTEYASGWDGYYYLVQVQSLNNTGVMHSPEYSLVYVPLLALHSITGDYVISYRISTVLIKLLFVLSIFSLSLSFLRSSGSGRREAFLTALLTAALSSTSPSMNYFFTQFPKNLLGFTMFFFFMSSVFGAARYRGERESLLPGGGYRLRITATVLLFLAAFFTHRFSAVLSLLFLVLYFAPSAWNTLKHFWMGGGGRKGRFIFLLAIVFLLLVLFISNRLPLAPSIRDLERITGDLSFRPVFVPASFIGTFGVQRLSAAWQVEIFIAAFLPLLSCVLLFWRRRFGFLHPYRGYYILIILSLTGLFPFAGFSLTGLSYRLFFGTLLMLPLLLIPYFRIAVLKLKAGAVPLLVFLVLLALSFSTAKSYRPEIHDPPYSLYEKLADEAVESLWGRACELIIAHKALAEMITFRYEIDALPWAPEDYFHRDSVWRITAGILEGEFAYYLSPGVVDSYFVRLSGDYGLLREDQWTIFMDSICHDSVMMEAVNTWRNPLEQRPMYLGKSIPTKVLRHLTKNMPNRADSRTYSK